MDGTGAYGGGKAGGSFDPISFVQRPPVLLRGVCWVRETLLICISYIYQIFISLFSL